MVPEFERPQISDAESVAYEQFCLQKAGRAHVDIYTAFVPFNEATRAFHVFLDLVHRHVPKRILVLWDRSCYLARLLQSALPDAEIWVTWEGDKDVLGRRGFAYWTQDIDTPGTPQPVFCDHTRPMNFFADGHFDLLVGMDVLHRIELTSFLQEVDRLLSPSGAAIFPHVHLSNSQPEPFFERGGTYRSGSEYASVLNDMGKRGRRQAFVHSEPALFRLNESHGKSRCGSQPDHSDYNGLVAWIPDHWWEANETLTLRAWAPHLEQFAQCRGLLNPLVAWNLHRGTAGIDDLLHDGFAGKMLRRHPIYREHLQAIESTPMTLGTRKLLHHLEEGLTVSESCRAADVTEAQAMRELQPWIECGGLFLVPLAKEGHRMQMFLGNSKFRLGEQRRSLPGLFQRRILLAPKKPLLQVVGSDGWSLSADEILESVDLLAGGLLAGGLGAGRIVSSQLPPSAELLVVVWAAWRIGCVFSPREGDVAIDDMDAFDHWIDNCPDDVHFPQVLSTSPAVRLFTSGSTGAPKPIVLTHQQLIESAAAMMVGFQLRSESNVFVHHGVETMSGLRNAAVLPLLLGSTIFMPSSRESVGHWLPALHESRAEIITGNPSLFHQVAQWNTRMERPLDFITHPLCTGAPLSPQVREAWLATGAAPLLNYYGLTETTGCFLAEQPGATAADVGRPVAGLVDIDANTGALRVHGHLVAAGEANADGFFSTGDQAKWTPHHTIELTERDARRFKTPDEELISLSSIEAALRALDCVTDVHCIRRSDGVTEFAEALCVVRGGAGLAQVNEAIQQAQVPQKLQPRRIHLVPNLPRNLAGKVPKTFEDEFFS